MNNNNRLNINHLPHEIVGHEILKYANRADILNVRLVNRTLRNEFQNEVPAYRMQIYSRNPDLNANKIAHIQNPNIELTSEDMLSCIRNGNQAVRDALRNHRQAELEDYELHNHMIIHGFLPNIDNINDAVQIQYVMNMLTAAIQNPDIPLISRDIILLIRNGNQEVHDALMEHRQEALEDDALHNLMISQVADPNIALTSENILFFIRNGNQEVRNALEGHRQAELDDNALNNHMIIHQDLPPDQQDMDADGPAIQQKIAAAQAMGDHINPLETRKLLRFNNSHIRRNVFDETPEIICDLIDSNLHLTEDDINKITHIENFVIDFHLLDTPRRDNQITAEHGSRPGIG